MIDRFGFGAERRRALRPQAERRSMCRQELQCCPCHLQRTFSDRQPGKGWTGKAATASGGQSAYSIASRCPRRNRIASCPVQQPASRAGQGPNSPKSATYREFLGENQGVQGSGDAMRQDRRAPRGGGPSRCRPGCGNMIANGPWNPLLPDQRSDAPRAELRGLCLRWVQPNGNAMNAPLNSGRCLSAPRLPDDRLFTAPLAM